MKSVVVITPTTGAESLIYAISSVKQQTYKGTIKHLVVVDGRRFLEPMLALEQNYPDVMRHISQDTVYLNDNVGANGFYGHRIYAAFPHLINEDIVFFLDQDNTFEPTHIETMVEALEADPDIHWVHSLRNIFQNDKFLCEDNCECLGKFPVWNSPINFHVDTSAYAFRREFLISVCHLWHQGYGGDRIFLSLMNQHFGKDSYDCTGKYTLNYYLDGNPGSASPQFFIMGNNVMETKYPNKNFPWSK